MDGNELPRAIISVSPESHLASHSVALGRAVGEAEASILASEIRERPALSSQDISAAATRATDFGAVTSLPERCARGYR